MYPCQNSNLIPIISLVTTTYTSCSVHVHASSLPFFHTISIFFSISSSSISVSKETTQQQLMANDAVLRTCLVCLGALILLIGLYTYSFKKMFATYVFGILAISGILLPDWDFFDRDFSQWVYPMSADTHSAQTPRSKRFRFYPVRVVLYTMIYSFGLYKWWMYVFNT